MDICLEIEELDMDDQLIQGYLQGTIQIIAVSKSFSINPHKEFALHAGSL